MMDQYIGYVAVFSSRAPTIMAGGHSQFFLNCSREAVSTSYFWRRIRSVRSVIAPTTFKIYVIIRPSHCKTAVKILKKVHVETLCRVLVGRISQVRETYCPRFIGCKEESYDDEEFEKGPMFKVIV